MKIRTATLQDKNTIVRLMDEFNDYYFDENIFSKEFVPFWEYKDKHVIFDETAQEWLTKPEYIFFVAEENGKVIGYICGQVKERKPRVLDKEGYIHDWFVKKEWRKKGVGHNLYQKLFEEFKKQGCNRLGLLTNVGNKKTIDFYHQLGFIDESITMVRRTND